MEHPTTNIRRRTFNGRLVTRTKFIGRWALDAGCWMFFLLLVGCAHFQSQPLAPETTAAQLDSRRLHDDGLKKFLEQNLGHEFTNWPLESWDLNSLTLTAFY